MGKFFDELKRRNVIRVTVAYAVVSWVLLQVLAIVLPPFGAPNWVLRVAVVVMAIGILPVMLAAWVYEITPEGIRRDEEVDRRRVPPEWAARRLDIAVIVLLVIALGLYAWDRLVYERESGASQSAAGSGTPVSRYVVAVLPLVDLRAAGANPTFAEGLHEEILNAFAGIPDFDLVSRTSVTGVTTDRPVGEIAAHLHATHVLEGSLRGNKDEMRIVVQLIAASEDRHLFSWSRDFKVKLDTTRTQVDIANQVAGRARFMLRPDDWISVSSPLSSNPKAVDRYRAGEMAERYDGWGAGLPHFQEALSLDKDFALAHIGVAFALLRAYGLDRRDEILRHVEMVRALAPDFPEIELIEGWISLEENKAERALAHFKAVEPALDRSVWLRAGKGFLLRDSMGRASEALVEWEAAATIDPYMFWPVANVGYLRFAARRYDAAIAYLADAQKRWPLAANIPLWRLQTEFARRGDVARLAQDMEQMITDYLLRRDKDFVLQLAVQVAMFSGRYDEALQALGASQNPFVGWGWGSLSGRYLPKDCLTLELLSLAGRVDEARSLAAAMEPRLAKAAAENSDPRDLGRDLVHACALVFAGQVDEARTRLSDMVDRAADIYAAGSTIFGEAQQDFAALAVWANDHDLALELLRRSLDAPMGGAHAAVVAVDPVWKPLHEDPRFAALLAEHGQYTFRITANPQQNEQSIVTTP